MTPGAKDGTICALGGLVAACCSVQGTAAEATVWGGHPIGDQSKPTANQTGLRAPKALAAATHSRGSRQPQPYALLSPRRHELPSFSMHVHSKALRWATAAQHAYVSCPRSAPTPVSMPAITKYHAQRNRLTPHAAARPLPVLQHQASRRGPPPAIPPSSSLLQHLDAPWPATAATTNSIRSPNGSTSWTFSVLKCVLKPKGNNCSRAELHT